MNQDLAKDKILKDIEIEISALRRITFSILKTMTEEQRKFIHDDIELMSLQITSEIDSDNSSLHQREQLIRRFALAFFPDKEQK
ncbi:hypothetical protein [Morganella morganii]|uniref:hypothetical protein n=1 Tax=Morganella morganii TaxID=582 RepID=UPI001405154B|nr:hypothetical protein [Morganella morganii]MBS9572303.1 hypothetical protein [Morganella morganii subsp. morganii]QIM77852.1 hypothetical protein F3L16_18155 [Morganella morganii subsp. morganii]